MLRHERPRVVDCLLGLALIVTAVSPATAQVVCPLSAITDGFGFGSVVSIDASISADGTRVAFTSNSDHTGGNSDNNLEIFLWDNGVLVQITDTLGPTQSSSPSISGDGSRIAFTSDADLTGGNADGSFEIFVWDGLFEQVTSSTTLSRAPVMSTDGSTVVFESQADFTGGNADGAPEIFAWNGITMTQISDSPASPSFTPTVNADGSVIAFGSIGDLTGQNADGSHEIFSWNAGVTTQITDGLPGAFSRNPSLDATGARLAFTSDLDLVGSNPDFSTELFLLDGMTIRQLTDFVGLSGVASVAISGDGSSIAFSSPADITGGGTSGNTELFLWRDDFISQLTNSVAPAFFTEPTLDADGDTLATVGSTDGGSEIFVASCQASTAVQIPTTQPVGLSLLALLLAVAGFKVLRSRTTG
ncbi:MAG: hypothetical protein AAGE94_14375 [Acidobacteriota bacterium]